MSQVSSSILILVASLATNNHREATAVARLFSQAVKDGRGDYMSSSSLVQGPTISEEAYAQAQGTDPAQVIKAAQVMTQQGSQHSTWNTSITKGLVDRVLGRALVKKNDIL